MLSSFVTSYSVNLEIPTQANVDSELRHFKRVFVGGVQTVYLWPIELLSFPRDALRGLNRKSDIKWCTARD